MLIYTNSADQLDMPVLAGFKDKSAVEKREHRTRGGLVTYPTGSYQAYSVPVIFLNSKEATYVNSWWAGQDAVTVVFSEFGIAEITAKIVNTNPPINEKVKPYDGLYKGVIELRTF